MDSPTLSRRRLLLGTGGLVLGASGAAIARLQNPPSESATSSSFRQAPELIGRPEDWINTGSRPPHLYGADGLVTANRVVVLAIWTYQCINCKRTIPYWNEWARRYAGKDDKPSEVAVVSVHTPELASERVLANVKKYVEERKILFPVLTDNEFKNWKAYGVGVWPTTFLIDKKGKVRGKWQGELNWQNSGEYARVLNGIELLRREK